MARKNDGRKTAASGRKGAAAKPHAGRAGVSKRAAQPAAKGVKGGAKPAAATPAPAKVKFRGRVLENEPLARYTTYRLGGPARYFVLPADPDDVAKTLALAQERGLPWLALGLGSNVLVKNPGGPRTAGVLIDECGLKGFTIGGAQVSPLHANYIVNTGNATASDVLKVIEHVRKTVAKKTSVELELEVKVIG